MCLARVFPSDWEPEMDVLTDPPRRSLLDHFSAVPDPRQAWRVAHPLPEVLLLVVCGTIAANDDYDDIVDWGEAHLSFLRRFSAFHFGLPCADWLRTLMNRIDPDLFSACFLSWVREWWPEVPDLIALDGKTARRSYDRKAGRKALHLVSAFATNERLVLGQEACAEKSNETTAIPALLARLAAGGHLKGALVSIDAVACNPDIAQAVVDGGAEYLLAVKANQPTLHDEVVAFFDTAQAEDVEAVVEVDKDHGRIETRRCVVSRQIDWLTGERRFPGESRFAKLTVVAMVEARIELRDRCTVERRFTSPPPRSRPRAALKPCARIGASRPARIGCWTCSSARTTRAYARGMEPRTWRSRFALNLVRQASDQRSLKRRRKCAGWDTQYLAQLLRLPPR